MKGMKGRAIGLGVLAVLCAACNTGDNVHNTILMNLEPK